MTDFLDVKRGEITERLKELKPAVDEYSRLEAAAAALAGVGAVGSRDEHHHRPPPWTGTPAWLRQKSGRDRLPRPPPRSRGRSQKSGPPSRVR